MKQTNMISLIGELQDVDGFREQYWEGSFEEYLDIVQRNPKVTRSAYQRLYDMILSYGTEEYTRNRESIVHYKFFDDPFDDGRDAIYGLDKALAQLVQIFESAARRYGTEKRVLLLHGPVGSAKSTIVRLLKKGLEAFCRTNDGALYTLSWMDIPDMERMNCPMHEDPLHLIPLEFRSTVLAQWNEGHPPEEHVVVEGEMSPAFDEFAFNMEIAPDTLSEPIRDETVTTKGGYWLVKVMGREDDRQIDDSDKTLLKNKAMEEWVSSLWDDPENEIDDSMLDDERKAWAIDQALRD